MRYRILTTVTATLFGIGLIGCNPTSAPSPATAPASTTDDVDHSDHDHAHDDHAHDDQGEKSPMEQMAETLAKLPVADRASAEKQHFCPVSGEMLGTMGLPIQVSANDQQVWLCCNACEAKFTADPASYLAKVNKD